MRPPIRPDDASGTVCAGQHCGGELTTRNFKGNRDAAHRCGPRQPRRTGQRLPELAPPARRAPLVREIGHLPQGGKHPPRQALIQGRCATPKQPTYTGPKAQIRRVAGGKELDCGGQLLVNPLQPFDHDAEETTDQPAGNFPSRRRFHRSPDRRKTRLPSRTKHERQRPCLPEMRQTYAETYGEKRNQFGKGVLELLRIPSVQRD